MPLRSLAYRYRARDTHRNIRTTNDVEDIIEQEFNNLFDQWRKLTAKFYKLTDEIFSELIEQHEIGAAALQKKRLHRYSSQFRRMSIVSQKKVPARGQNPRSTAKYNTCKSWE